MSNGAKATHDSGKKQLLDLIWQQDKAWWMSMGHS
jgi:hypothetical protein